MPEAGNVPFARWRKRRARARLVGQIVTPNGDVRGFHGRCPRTPPPFLGQYTLCLDAEGHICCYGCGAHDLEVRR